MWRTEITSCGGLTAIARIVKEMAGSHPALAEVTVQPAYSVILFTTASGAGYGLLIWLSLAALAHGPAMNWWFAAASIALALTLITGGLLASTFHLGRPERAWRAFSQWRTSWLSREGVAALVTYVPACALGAGWIPGAITADQTAVAAWLAVCCALVTLYCTGMIYASLQTIRAWHQPLVAPVYIVLALATGGVLLCVLLAAYGRDLRIAAAVTVLALAAGWLLKRRYWSAID